VATGEPLSRASSVSFGTNTSTDSSSREVKACAGAGLRRLGRLGHGFDRYLELQQGDVGVLQHGCGPFDVALVDPTIGPRADNDRVVAIRSDGDQSNARWRVRLGAQKRCVDTIGIEASPQLDASRVIANPADEGDATP